MTTGDAAKLVVRPRTAALVLAAVAGLLVLAHIAASGVIVWRGSDPGVVSAMGRFLVEEEMSFPTVFSFVLLLLISTLLAAISILTRQTDPRTAGKWLLLAGVFLFLSLDEILALHEVLDRRVMMRLFPGPDTPMGVLWTIPYVIAMILLGAWFWRFFWGLPQPTRMLFSIAALLFIAGAIGADTILGPFFEAHGMEFMDWVATTLEETLEMAGAITFIYALALYLEREFPGHRLRISSARGPGSRRGGEEGASPVR